MLRKKISGVQPHNLDVWMPAHQGNGDASKKLVSYNFECYASFFIYTYLLNILQERYTGELKKIYGPELEDSRLVPFNVDAMYAAGRGIPHGRYVKISIIFH
jgi:hypothetical protein